MAQSHPFHKLVIAVTGSAGKSTTKEMIAAILQRKWKIIKTVGNANGTKAAIHDYQSMTKKHHACVLEYGLLRMGHIARHCRAVPPDVAVITNVGSAHIGRFGGSLSKLASGKSEIIRGMNPAGWLFLNGDDPGSKLLATSHFQGKIVKVGIQNEADYRATAIKFSKTGMTFTSTVQEEEHSFFIPIHGEHHVYNALLAIAVADQLGFSPLAIKNGLRSYDRPSRRANVHVLRDDRLLIDDTYSANPHATKGSLQVLRELGKGTRTIAALGSMLEMGVYEKEAHCEVGRYVAEQQVDYLLTYGREAKWIGKAAIAAGMESEKVFHFRTQQGLIKKLLLLMQPNSTVLVKGSNAMNLSPVSDRLMREFVLSDEN